MAGRLHTLRASTLVETTARLQYPLLCRSAPIFSSSTVETASPRRMETVPTTTETSGPIMPLFAAGDKVITAYGQGQVLRVVQDDAFAAERYAIALSGWTMAQGQHPVLFMSLEEKSLKRYEAPVDAIAAMFDACTKKKDAAAELFKAQDFEGAKNLYADVLGMINGLSGLLPQGETVSDVTRARIIELIIPCQNNIALCCLNLRDYNGCLEIAKAASDLVEGCQTSPGLDRILASRDITEEKLQVDFKKKSHLYMGKAFAGRSDYERALEQFQAGLKIVEAADRKTDIKSFADLIDMCRRSLKRQEEREKKTWGNVFKRDASESSSSAAASAREPINVSETKKVKEPTITTPFPPPSPNVNDDDAYINDGDDDDDEEEEEEGGVFGAVGKFLTDNSPLLLAGTVATVGIAVFALLRSRK